MNQIVVAGSGVAEITKKEAEKAARRILEILGIWGSYLEIMFLGNKDMAILKRSFLPKKEGPANVLAFREPEGFPHPESMRKPLGTIYLNRDLHRKETKKLIFLLLHGVLHLLGFGHNKKGDILKMEKLEQKLWPQISSLD